MSEIESRSLPHIQSAKFDLPAFQHVFSRTAVIAICLLERSHFMNTISPDSSASCLFETNR